MAYISARAFSIPLPLGQSSMDNMGHAEARAENTHSGKMAHIPSICAIIKICTKHPVRKTNSNIYHYIFIISQLWLTSQYLSLYIYHFSTVVDFSSEKYSGSTGHRNSWYQ